MKWQFYSSEVANMFKMVTPIISPRAFRSLQKGDIYRKITCKTFVTCKQSYGKIFHWHVWPGNRVSLKTKFTVLLLFINAPTVWKKYTFIKCNHYWKALHKWLMHCRCNAEASADSEVHPWRTDFQLEEFRKDCRTTNDEVTTILHSVRPPATWDRQLKLFQENAFGNTHGRFRKRCLTGCTQCGSQRECIKPVIMPGNMNALYTYLLRWQIRKA